MSWKCIRKINNYRHKVTTIRAVNVFLNVNALKKHSLGKHSTIKRGSNRPVSPFLRISCGTASNNISRLHPAVSKSESRINYFGPRNWRYEDTRTQVVNNHPEWDFCWDELFSGGAAIQFIARRRLAKNSAEENEWGDMGKD